MLSASSPWGGGELLQWGNIKVWGENTMSVKQKQGLKIPACFWILRGCDTHASGGQVGDIVQFPPIERRNATVGHWRANKGQKRGNKPNGEEMRGCRRRKRTRNSRGGKWGRKQRGKEGKRRRMGGGGSHTGAFRAFFQKVDDGMHSCQVRRICSWSQVTNWPFDKPPPLGYSCWAWQAFIASSFPQACNHDLRNLSDFGRR